MIAVRRERQGEGRGSRLLAHGEDHLRQQAQRLLLVETSGTPSFEDTRSFYRALRYDEEARVRDYYASGDDMVLFRKSLIK